MPLHQFPLSRRRFLAHAAAATAGAVVLPGLRAADSPDESTFLALLSDTHIPSDETVTARNVNMTANLRRVVGELVALERKPAGVIINGDCAYLKGQPADYANLATCLAPLTTAGLPVHLTMGNHDDRGPLYAALTSQRPTAPLVESKHVSVLEFPQANWFLLDSLFQVNVVQGELGAAQCEWLARELDARRDKPAIVMAHHNPQFEAPGEGQRWHGISDTAELFQIMEARSHVKAFIFGHSHDWSVSQRKSLHLINLPPVAYVFAEGKPNGWVAARVHARGLELELHTLDAQHPQAGQRVTLEWS